MNETEAKRLRQIVEAVRAVTSWKGTKVVDENDYGLCFPVSMVERMMTFGPSEVKLYVYLRLLAKKHPTITKDGVEIWPSQQTMAQVVGMSERTVRNALAGLEENGAILVHRSGVAERDRGQNFYLLKRWPF